MHSFGQHGRPLFVLCWRSMSSCSLIACSRDGCDRWRRQPPSILCWVLACVQHVDVNAATKTWIYFYALARVHCSNCCSHFKNSNTAGKAVWKILIIRLVSRPPTASPSPPHASLNLLPLAPYLCALQSKRHLPPSCFSSFVGHGSYLMQHAARIEL